MATPMPRPSQAATAIAAIVESGSFPEEAAVDLARLLGHELAAPPRNQQRYSRLGLLIDLVSRDCEFITSTEYERQRQLRPAQTETWPTAESLARAFGGHWLTAVKAAATFFFDGAAKVPASYAGLSSPRTPYTPQEILAALFACRRELELTTAGEETAADPQGGWPTQWEYVEWVRIKRDLARRSGNGCDLPGPMQIRRAFGGWDHAIGAAAAHFGRARA